MVSLLTLVKMVVGGGGVISVLRWELAWDRGVSVVFLGSCENLVRNGFG